MITQFNPGQPFKSAHSSAKWSTIFVTLCIFLDVIVILLESLQAGIAARGASGITITLQEAAGNDDKLRLVGSIDLIVVLVTGILVLRWTYCTYRNLPALGASDLRFTPRWAVGSYLFPILNLFRPYQAVTDIWKASNPLDIEPTGTAWKEQDTSPVILIWWLAWLLSDILSLVSIQFSRLTWWSSLQTASWFAVASAASHILAGVLLIRIISTVDTWQEEKLDRQSGPGLQYNSGAGTFNSYERISSSTAYAPAIAQFSIRRVPVPLPDEVINPSS